MIDLKENLNTEIALEDTRRPYAAPEALRVSKSAKLIQGGGGMSGLDYLYYYYLDGNGN